MPTEPTTASRPREAWAEVRAHDHVMRYRRCGAGRVVLVLDDAGGGEPLWPELIGTLAASCRLIAPVVPEGARSAAWLAGFLEGLGVSGVTVVAADAFCLPALELALLDPDRVRAVVLVPAGDAEPGALDGTLSSAAQGAPVRLLVARRGQPADEALSVVGRFLCDGGATGG